MAVKIRLRRMGSKKAPYYRVVVADSRYPRNGRFIEEIGTYDILKKPSEFKVDSEAVKKWIANGAQPTDTVKALLKKPTLRQRTVRSYTTSTLPRTTWAGSSESRAGSPRLSARSPAARLSARKKK